MDDLVKRNDVYFKKFTDVPFTGNVTGKYQGSFKNGKMDGPWVRYHDNGQFRTKGTFKDGKKDGPWVKYHKNGQLSWKGTFKDGKSDGPWVGYNEDGTVWGLLTGTFKDGKKVE